MICHNLTFDRERTAILPEPDLPRCELTDFVRAVCSHCRAAGVEQTEAEKHWLATAPEPQSPGLTREMILQISEYTSGRGWHGVDQGFKPAGSIGCEADGHSKGDRFLCDDCAEMLARHLSDVPQLVQDLVVAFQKDVNFGGPAGEANPEESPVAYGIGARRALDQLRNALPFSSEMAKIRSHYHPRIVASTARWMRANLKEWLLKPEIDAIAGRIARACIHARTVIDKPKDIIYYGECPNCRKDLRQERVEKHDPDAGKACPHCHARITCSHCGYSVKYTEHELNSINAGVDRWLTPDEMIGTVRSGGKLVTRRELMWWITRDGLPRETRNRPTLVNGELALRPVDVYRLGDVLELAAAAERDRNSLTTPQAAAYLGTSEANIRQMVKRKKLEPNDANRHPLRFTRENLDKTRASRGQV